MLRKCTICKLDKETIEFNKKSNRKDGLQVHCKLCNSERAKEYYRKNRKEHLVAVREVKRRVIERARTLIVNYLSTHPCVDCGEKDPVVLDFDHKDPESKYKCVSIMCCEGYGIDRLKLEIEKCDVRCANCHRRKTAKDFGYYKHAMTGS